jgi:cutinase
MQAAVTFGDPLRTQQFQNINIADTKINCNANDQVCNGMFKISAAHLAYGNNGDIPLSVQFLQGILG